MWRIALFDRPYCLGGKWKYDAGEIMARIVAKRHVEHLER
jgi:hypothetical protein